MGYAETVSGNYYLEGTDKYEVGLIGVPNQCGDGLDKMVYPIPRIPKKEYYPNPKAAECKKEESFKPYYPDNCAGFCDVKQMEYDVQFVDYEYSQSTDRTVFTYSLHTLKPVNLPMDFCSYYPYPEAVPLKEIYLSIPCECQYMLQNGKTLYYTTDGMVPESDANGVSQFHWHFGDLHVGVGETKNVSIILNGMIPFGYGDYTLIGEMDRCGYARHVIKVPDICNNRCLWGQWTKWETQWASCSKKCGGGITKRTRKCVSVCDAKTPVYNCYGESKEIIPCNTNACDQPIFNEELLSNVKYWSAYK